MNGWLRLWLVGTTTMSPGLSRLASTCSSARGRGKSLSDVILRIAKREAA